VNLIDLIKQNSSRGNGKILNDCTGTGTGANEPSEEFATLYRYGLEKSPLPALQIKLNKLN
jgi:hypothetical protein